MLCQILMSDPVFWRWTLFVILIKLRQKIIIKRSSPFFFSFPVECFSWYWVGLSDWKKKPKKKIIRSLGISGPGTPGRRQKSTFTYLDEQNAQHTVKNVLVFVPVFLYVVTMLNFEIKRIISSKKRLNYVVTFFFFENAKNLDRSDDSKRRKKRGWPNVQFKRIKPLLSNLEFIISSMIS